MKFLFDIFPILLFFIAYKFWGIYVATAVAIGVSILQVVYLLIARKKIEYTNWINAAIIALFGGLTLALHNDLFIKWKPTILYGIFALILLGGNFFYKKNLVKSLVGQALELPESVWEKVNWSWIIFFTILAVLNIAVAYTFPTDIWVDFKLFGLVGFTVLFVVIQSVWLSRYITIEK